MWTDVGSNYSWGQTNKGAATVLSLHQRIPWWCWETRRPSNKQNWASPEVYVWFSPCQILMLFPRLLFLSDGKMQSIFFLPVWFNSLSFERPIAWKKFGLCCEGTGSSASTVHFACGWLKAAAPQISSSCLNCISSFSADPRSWGWSGLNRVKPLYMALIKYIYPIVLLNVLPSHTV